MPTARDAAITALRPHIEKLADRMPPEVAINIGEIADAVLAAIGDSTVLRLPRYYVRDEATTIYPVATFADGDVVAFGLDTSATTDLTVVKVFERPGHASPSDYERVDEMTADHDNLRNFCLAALAAIEDQHARNQR